ncbi:PQQ-binding-like beta-propeller repeat protein [Cohnella hashimotonis]|uniref:PQQ-binding-like beta-propeller repeat protein n=1 Tax=Cohnella hashimotonis TaxID=2826895 RepID=A0ABT6TKW7_9BACL|nr:PQQ-binding-like beta-propeller repeat protein [Cohnella hashimotonis]MDI4647488.1 PQQ-binding-like beta-propeller repeat protein [Cohnella hashimotonis]
MKKRIALKVLVFLAVFLMGIQTSGISAATVHTAKPFQLPSNVNQELKYTNDRGEHLKFRGFKNYPIKWIKEIEDANDMRMNKEKNQIFVVSGHRVISYDLSGKEQWQYALKTSSAFDYTLLELGADGTIYAIRQPQSFLDQYTPGYITALTAQGTLLWEYELVTRNTEDFVTYRGGADGTFVTYSDDGIIGIRNGGIAWKNTDILKVTTTQFNTFEFKHTNVNGFFTGPNGTTYVETEDKIYALDDTGKLLWSNNISSDATLVNNGKYILLTSSTGPWVLWDAATGATLPTGLINTAWLKDSGIPNDGKGNIYVSRKDGGISKVDAKGKVLWSYKIRFPGYSDAYVSHSDAKGNVYFTDNGGTLYSLDPNGNERFILLYREQYGPMIVPTDTDKDGNVYALFDPIGLFKISSAAAAKGLS